LILTDAPFYLHLWYNQFVLLPKWHWSLGDIACCFEVEVTLRLTVCLGIEYTCGTCDQILFPVAMLLSEICCLVSVRRPFWREVWGHVKTGGQSVSMSWRWAHLGTCYQILILSEFCCVVFVGRPLWREVGSVSCQSLSAIIVHRQVLFYFIFVCFFPILLVTHVMYIQYMQGLVSPGSVQQIMLHHV
jgi:hypothetical protein